MTVEQNQETLRQVINRAFNQGDYSVLPEAFNPDFVEHQFGLHPTIEGMEKDIRGLRTSFPDFNVTIEDIVADGEKVWVRMTGRGTNLGSFLGAPTGKRIEITVFDMVRFEDGKIVEHWGSPDRFAALAQLGLLPTPEKREMV